MSQSCDAPGAVVVIFYKPKRLIFLLLQILFVGGIHYRALFGKSIAFQKREYLFAFKN